MSQKVRNPRGFSEERFIARLQGLVHVAVRILAALVTFVILWGILDVVWELYCRLTAPPVLLLDIRDILDTLGVFLAVLIAIEIFANIIVYLKEETIHVKIVLSTALIAVARKIILFDYKELSPAYIYASAAVVLALSVGYWLVLRYEDREQTE